MKKQNNKLKILLYPILLVVLLMGFVSATESCFIRLNINETLIQNGPENVSGIDTIFDSQQNIYGNYNSSVEVYDNKIPQTYVLRTYNGMNNILNSYSLNTGLIVYYDTFGNETDPGGVGLLNESQTSAIIPYDPRINKITIGFFNSSDEQELAGFDASLISCERSCKIPGESGVYGIDKCCEGFTPTIQLDNTFACIKPNDGICDNFENQYNSFRDCLNLSSYFCKPGYIQNEFGGCTNETLAYCGDGIIEPANGEECDDGNNESGDDCSSTCKLEGVASCLEQVGSVLFNDTLYQNTCNVNDSITYSCHLNIFTWDFSKIFRYSLGQNIQTCSYGCLNGVCINPPVMNCSDGIQNQGETGIDCGGPCSACILPVCNNNGICEINENFSTCSSDCSAPSCGNHICENNENCSSCSGDCGSCSGDAGSCNKIGTRETINGTSFYCDLSGNYLTIKSDGANCDNNFECLNNLCSNGECVNLYAEAKNNKNLAQNITVS